MLFGDPESAAGRSRVAADQLAHGWSATRGRYMLSQPQQQSFERKQQAMMPQAMPQLAAPRSPVYNGMQQRAACRSQPVGGRLQFGAEAGGLLEERQREQAQRMTTEQILREQQRRERQEVEERRERVLEAKRREAAAASAERREHQDQYELMLKRRLAQAVPQPTLQPPTTMSPAREYELAKQEEARVGPRVRLTIAGTSGHALMTWRSGRLRATTLSSLLCASLVACGQTATVSVLCRAVPLAGVCRSVCGRGAGRHNGLGGSPRPQYALSA